MTTENFSPLGVLTSRTTLTFDSNTPAVVDLVGGRVELNPTQKKAKKQKNRAKKAGKKAARK